MNYKKILYIGPYREFGGAANSSRNFIHALHRAGHDVCIAPIYTTGDIYPENEISSEILPLENNFLKSYDIVIQHCHPCEYVYKSGWSLNIGVFQFDSFLLPHTLSSRLKLVDRIVVNSMNNYNVVQKILIDHEIKYCPELINEELVHQSYKKYEWANMDLNYKFYLIGDFVNRKNFIKAISGYISAFTKYDNVELILKTKPHYTHNNDQVLHKELEYELEKIYNANKLKKADAPQIKIMIGKFNYHDLLTLHYNANCFIDISMGENFGYSTLEAAMFNKDIIVNSKSSSNEIPTKKYQVLAKACNVHDPFAKNFLDNRTNNLWYDVDFEDYILCLKRAYENRYNNEQSNDLSRFYYSNINNLIC